MKSKAESDGEPIPVTYIPRKPHPNGLLLYQLVTYVQHPAKSDSVLPWILDICPHLQTNDCSAQDSVRYFIKR